MFSKQGFVTVCLVILAALLITGCAPTTPVAVTGVILNQAIMTLTVGGATGTLVATVMPADATNQSVTWSSSAPAVATVANGVVTPVTAGTATIIVATVDGGLTATCTVTVNPVAVAVTGVILNQAIMTLTAGGATGTLVATVAPADATNQSVTWSSSAPAVATVANGVVTPVTAGTTTIIVATVDGGFIATCTVTVNPAVVAIGDSYGGGIVAYILQSGDPGYDAGEQHGLIAAPADQSTGIQWYNGSWVAIGATGTAIGTGQANTTAIVTVQGAGSYAAQLCDALTEGGYADWFLPSKDELNKLYINKAVIGGFAVDYYWSSSELNEVDAWSQDFSNGVQSHYYKYNTFRVRAVRAF